MVKTAYMHFTVRHRCTFMVTSLLISTEENSKLDKQDKNL